MRMVMVSFAVAVVAFQAKAADQTAPPARTAISILGVTLGEPLTGNTTEMKGGPPGVPSLGMQHFQVRLADGQRPRFMKYQYFFADVIDGKVEGVTVFTTGQGAERDALRQLTEKFGAPSASEEKVKQNRLGVAFTYTDARWTLPTGEVRFEGLTSDADTGRISANSTAMLAKYVEQAKAMRATEPSL